MSNTNKHHESHTRSIIKTITWRVIATVTTFSLVWIFTGDVTTAFEVGGIEVFIKLLFYFLHERAWNHIHWGKQLKTI